MSTLRVRWRGAFSFSFLSLVRDLPSAPRLVSCVNTGKKKREKSSAQRTRSVLDALHRLAYRHGYKLAKRYWRLTRRDAQGAAVAVTAEGRLLVVRHSYAPGFGLPAGGIAKGETPQAAARRELMEETGIEAAEAAFDPAFVHSYGAHGRKITNHVFVLHLDACVDPSIDRRELIWAGWRDPDVLDPKRCNPTLRGYLRRLKEDETFVP